MSADHRAIVTPDSRGRFTLAKFLPKTPGLEFKVFVEDDGNSVRLEAVEAK